jgi:hypothetical protein
MNRGAWVMIRLIELALTSLVVGYRLLSSKAQLTQRVRCLSICRWSARALNRRRPLSDRRVYCAVDASVADLPWPKTAWAASVVNVSQLMTVRVPELLKNPATFPSQLRFH